MTDSIITRFTELPLRPGLVPDPDPDQFCKIHGLPGWEYDLGKPQRREGRACRRFRILAPLGPAPGSSDLTIFGHSNVIDGFKVSLPAVIHGSNMRLIESQAEIDRALNTIAGLINQVAEFNLRTAGLHFTRVDLTLQFSPPHIPPSAFFASLRNCRHMRIRGDTIYYQIRDTPSGPVFKGAELTIKAYDKILKHTGRPGNVTRIEIELHRGILRELLGNPDGGYPSQLNFHRCYGVYRHLLMQLEPARRLSLNGGLGTSLDYAALLAAHCENQDILLPDGRRPVELYRDNFSPPMFIEFRKRVAAAQLSLNEISFAELLPAHWPARHLVSNAELPPQHQIH